MNDDDLATSAWHLDKRVPIALILSLVAQTLAIVWWAATASARLDQLERQVNASAPQSERIIRLEAKVDAIGETLGELKTLFRRPSGMQ